MQTSATEFPTVGGILYLIITYICEKLVSEETVSGSF
jgi:hypothetical protein